MRQKKYKTIYFIFCLFSMNQLSPDKARLQLMNARDRIVARLQDPSLVDEDNIERLLLDFKNLISAAILRLEEPSPFFEQVINGLARANAAVKLAVTQTS